MVPSARSAIGQHERKRTREPDSEPNQASWDESRR